MDPQKRVSKNFVFDRAVSKTPPPGPLINSSFWSHQITRGKIAFSDFRVFVFFFWPIILFFWFCSPAKNYPQISSHSSGVAKKQGKISVFLFVSWLFCFCDGVFPCGVLMLVFLFMYLLRCQWLIRPCCLIVPFVFFLVSVIVFFFWGGGYSSFDINHFNGPASMTKKQDQNTENPNIWIFVFDVLLWGPHPHTFSSPGPHTNRNPKPSTPENRICLLHNRILCGNAYF